MGALGRGGIFLFEGFRLDRHAGILLQRREDGTFAPMVLGSRALDVLYVLVERAGDLVSRDEFMAAVWPATAVEDANLNMQIAALRRVLDEERADGSCIQTIPGRGYRFAAPVTRVESSTPLASGSPSGNGAGDPTAELPGPPIPAAPRNTPPFAPPRELKWLWRGSLALVGGALCLLTAVVTASNWHLSPLGGARPAPRLSIVVLPFANLSGDPEQQYFADGVTEDLTIDLSRIADSFVISRNTAFTYKDKPVNARQTGRELGVRYLLEGSVQRSGQQVRVNAQLIDAETDAHVWAERFERDTSDLFALQDEITSRIAVALNFALIGAEAARPAANPDALDYILRGRAAMNRPPTRENYVEAIGFFKHALMLDPRSVDAQSWLATALVRRVIDQMSDSAAADIARAQGLIGQALAASPSSPFAHFAKGDLLVAQRQFAEAIPEYETVLAADRNSVDALAIIGRQKINIGMIDEAIPLVEQAIRHSPRDPRWIGIWYLWIGQAHLLQSRTDEAILWFEKAHSATPGLPIVHLCLTSAYALKGDSNRAAAELVEARRLAGDDRFSSIARVQANGYWGVPKVRTLFEPTLLAGLRKAGMPEE
jgi:TolB-like protein/DNA-binding winged helix-turn-helix (wHTH) protein